MGQCTATVVHGRAIGQPTPGSVFTNCSSEHGFSLQDLSYLKETQLLIG